jgi:arsenical pump membrane protein
MLALHNAALPVLAVGLVAVTLRRLRPAIGVPVLAGLFLVTAALGTLARRWHGPAHMLRHLDGPATAAVAAVAAVLVNNLPAAALLSAQRPPHPLELLLGLDLGPNLAVTGSLSAYLWYRAARATGARPSFRLSSVLGLVLVPVTLAAALLALRVTA